MSPRRCICRSMGSRGSLARIARARFGQIAERPFHRHQMQYTIPFFASLPAAEPATAVSACVTNSIAAERSSQGGRRGQL